MTRRILVCGPDGSGKSAVAAALLEELPRAQQAHYRRTFRSSRMNTPVPEPGTERPRNVAVAAAKIILHALINVLVEVAAHVTREQRPLVMERGWHDQLVHPQRYRLPKSALPLIRLLGRIQPRYDLALLCHGNPEGIHARKPELHPAEIRRQLDVWERLLPAVAEHHVRLDTISAELTETHEAVRQALHEATPAGLHWRRLLIVPRRLWLLVTQQQSDENLLEKLYRPRRAVARAVVTAQVRLTWLQGPTPVKLANRLDAALRALAVRPTAAAAMASSRRNRFVCCASIDRVLVYIKAGDSADEGLRNEAAFLQDINARTTAAPRLLRIAEAPNLFAMATTEIDGRQTAGLEGAIPAVRLLANLDLTHGDLAPWNIYRRGDGSVQLLDFEVSTSPHVPFRDLAYLLVTVGAHLGELTVESAVKWLTAHFEDLARYAHDAGDPVGHWPSQLAAELRTRVWRGNGDGRWATRLARELGGLEDRHCSR